MWVRKDKQIYIQTYKHTHTFWKTISGNQARAHSWSYNVSTKRIILKQVTKLQSTWSNISQNKLLRDELKSRRSAGEKDIYIKCGRIVSRPGGAGTSTGPSN